MKKILIIDDEENARKMYGLLLRAEGFRVVEAGSFAEAKEALTKMDVRLVLLDIDLPDAEGATVHHFILKLNNNIKVIIISIYSLREQRLMLPNADDYFEKIDGTDILLEKVRHILKENNFKQDQLP